MKHFISSLSVLCANTPPYKGRVSSRKILSLLLILFLSIGNVWAETVTWEKATSIAAGDVVSLVCETKSMELSSITTYGLGVAYTTTPAGVYELTIEEGTSTGTVSFKNGSTYLNWSSKNTLSTSETKNANSSWTVTFEEDNAIILNVNDNTRKLQWNAGSPRFACYTSAQTAVQLYKKVTTAGGGETPDPTPDPEEGGSVYKLVTSTSELEAGAKYVIGNALFYSAVFMSNETNTNNRKQTESITINEGQISTTDKVLVLELGGSTGAWTFLTTNYTSTNGYLTSAASGNNNHCKVVETAEACSYFTISFDDQSAVITSTGRSERNILRYNSSSSLFACYTSNQNPVYLYKEVTTPADPTTVAKPVISGTDNFYNSTEVSITCATADAKIYYTLDDTEPTISSTLYSAPFTLNETKTVKAIAVKADMANSAVAEKNFTKATVLTVAEALTAIDNGGDLTNKYVKGTISQIKEYNPTYSSIYYYISDDGNTTNELYVYSGKGLNSANFSAVTDLTVGDDVIICGTLKKYSGTYEFDKNNYLVYHKPVAQLSWSKSTCTAEIGGTNEFPTLTNTNSVAVSYSSSNTAAATINETTGEITLVAAGETTITATFTGNENYKANSASYTLTVAEAVVRGTITYNTNGGTEVAAQENQTNLPETLPTTTKAGYNFGGWYTDAEFNTPAVANSVLTGDITLHAKWLEPYTVAQALAMNATTGVYVKGIISTITEVNTGYKNATYKISDDGTTTSEMIVYRGKNVDNTDFTSEDQIAVGDIVVIYGNLSEYNSAIQLAQGNYIYSLTEPTLYTVTISFETNGGETVESIEANTLPDPFPTTTKEGHAFDGWYMDNALTIPAVAGTPITTDADITLYAKWVEVSKWATTYTSNIEVGSDKVIINKTEYEAKKTGTSSAYGSTSVVVPVSTHTLHFHAAGWGADNLVNLVVKNGETVLGTFELSKDAGVKSNSPYTLAGTPYQQYYSVSLTNITAETTITFEASTSGGKRFVLYGVNQEGGIVPELNRIEITGEATTLTYEIGDVFDPAGLGVNAIYTLAGVDHETVAIDAEDVEWSFNPATIAAETSQVEVTATYMEKTATKTVAGLTVNAPTPEITATPASIDWGTVNKDSEASKEVSVTLKAVANATISISGTNPEVFSVDKTALTEPGTIVVSANTSSVGTFTATLTISDDAEVAEAEKISLSITVEPIDYVGGNWQLVTDAATLKAGDMVIIASVEVEEKYYTMGKQNSNNRAAIESTVSETQLTPTTGTSVLTLVDAGDGKFAFQASNGKYLSAAGTGNNNYLREAENYDSDKTKWTISVTAEGIATIKATSDNRNWMRYNPNNGSPIFSCYGSGQKDIALYKRMPDYTRDVRQGYYGTICLPNGGMMFGASIFEIAYKDASKIYFDEIVSGKMEAGIPYIFLPSDGVDQIEVYYTDKLNVSAGSKNGLVGSYTQELLAANGKNYILLNNQYCEVIGEAYVGANRAYFQLSGIPTSAPAPAPGVRRVSMGMAGQNTATGVDQVQGDEVPTKMIINGQLFILRGEKMYDAQGKLVK